MVIYPGYFQGHAIVGIGDFSANTPFEMFGNMADAGASPNDPFFIVHHTMIDCVFDEWLKRHPDEVYPDVPLTPSTRGHQAQSYMIPFYPLYTNADMFKLSENFGYFCNLPNLPPDGDDDSGGFPKAHITLLTWLSVILTSIIVLY